MLGNSWYGPDIWYHLTWGRSLVEHGSFLPERATLLLQPLVANVYWLFQGVLYELFDFTGVVGVSLAFLLLWFLITAGWIVTARIRANSILGPALVFAFICCVQLRFEQRPEVVSYLLLVLMIWRLQNLNLLQPLRRRSLFVLFLIQTIWSNVHGYFALGPLLGLALMASALWPWNISSGEQFRRAAVCTLVLFVGSFVTPFGWHGWELVALLLKLGRGIREVNAELMPPQIFPLYWPMHLFWILWVMAIAKALWVLIHRRQSFAALLGLAGAALALQATRNVPLALLLAGPVLGLVVTDLERVLNRFGPQLGVLIRFAPGLIALGFIPSLISGDYFNEQRSLASFGWHLEPASYPIGAVEFLNSIRFKGKIFTDSYDGGYVEYQMPESKVSGDSYFTDSAMTLEFFQAIRNPPAMGLMDQRFVFDALLINIENLDVIQSVWKNSDWNLVYFDSHRLLFLRRPQYTWMKLDFDKMSVYHGENLKHWAYAFGVSSWAGLALKFQSLPMGLRVLHDVAPAPAIPSTLIRYMMGLCVRTKSAQLCDETRALQPRMYLSGEGDLEKIRELSTQVAN